jgi:hypothetical protein
MASDDGGSSSALFTAMPARALPHSPTATRTCFPAATRVRLVDENALPRYDGLPVEAGGAATEHERSDVVLAR